MNPGYSARFNILDATFSCNFKQRGTDDDPTIISSISYKFSFVVNTAAAAAAAKSLQSCPTLCDPIEGSLPGSAFPGILQERIPEWAAISFSNA